MKGFWIAAGERRGPGEDTERGIHHKGTKETEVRRRINGCPIIREFRLGNRIALGAVILN